jgi:4-hydroxybenzoate polyprenyltransferase/phosphoserine phosphatase
MSWPMDSAVSGVAFDQGSPQGPLSLDIAIPLVVDLDGTLFLSDTLQEILAATASRSPALAIAILSRIVYGRPTLKRYATENSDLDVASLPLRRDLMQLLNVERSRGRAIHLVTAADQAMADRVSSTFAIFTSAVGSDGTRNLKAQAKLEYLRKQFPNGFIYAGDSRADRPIFRAARGVILCDVNRAVARDVAASDTPVIAEFRQSEPLWKAWLRALRVRQWARNALIFVPLLVGHTLSEPKSVAMTCIGFLLLCAAASGTYLITGLAEIDADRRDASKREQPFANGRISIFAGFAAAVALIGGSLIAATFLSPAFASILLAYFVMSMLFSFYFNRISIFDVLTISALYTSRIVMGVSLSTSQQSPWLLSFSMCLFFSLALAKRHAEVMVTRNRGEGQLPGHRYRAEGWPLTLTFGVGTGIASIVILLLYVTSDAAPAGFYREISWLYVVPAVVMLWLLRIWLLSHRMQLDDDPIEFALRDGLSWLLGMVILVAVVLAI